MIYKLIEPKINEINKYNDIPEVLCIKINKEIRKIDVEEINKYMEIAKLSSHEYIEIPIDNERIKIPLKEIYQYFKPRKGIIYNIKKKPVEIIINTGLIAITSISLIKYFNECNENKNKDELINELINKTKTKIMPEEFYFQIIIVIMKMRMLNRKILRQSTNDKDNENLIK